MLTVHAANASLTGTTESAFASRQGYSGEQWDTSLRMQNLRARAYDPSNARFVGLDPFSGNMQDPQSLHKYAYVHGEPIQGVDPTGLFNAVQISVRFAVGGTISAATSAGVKAAFGQADQITAKSLIYEFVIGGLINVATLGIGNWFAGLKLSSGAAKNADDVAGGVRQASIAARTLWALPQWARSLSDDVVKITNAGRIYTLGRKFVGTAEQKRLLLKWLDESFKLYQKASATKGVDLMNLRQVGKPLLETSRGLRAGVTKAADGTIELAENVPLSTLVEEMHHFRYFYSKGWWRARKTGRRGKRDGG